MTPTSADAVTVDAYLSTTYRPDCDYIDGQVLERNLGESDHGTMQAFLVSYLWNLRKPLGITVIPEQRVQINPTRFRVPDVLVSLTKVTEPIVTTPPFLCIEILSRRDTWVNIQPRIDDYLRFGVPFVWAIDPRTLQAFVHTSTASSEVLDRVLRTENPEIAVPLSEFER